MISDNIPLFLRSILEGDRPVQLSLSQISGTNVQDTTSLFYYDAINDPLKSTQQLNIDWSKFDRHTFFSSAAANVNVAFDKIINGFPFDGTQQEFEAFLSKLTGFEKYVFESFPKYRGQLLFSGTQIGEAGIGGTYINVNDFAGGLYPELSKNKTGNSILDPKGNPLTIEMQLFLPDVNVIGKQVILQKSNGNNGFALLLSSSNTYPTGVFVVYSGTNFVSATCPLERGKFNHVCVTYHNDPPSRYVSFFKNEKLVDRSNKVSLGDLSLGKSELIIGSGSTININNSLSSFSYVPDQTFSGSIDELRIFHSERTISQQSAYAKRSIYASPDLKLYYRFNEPPPPLSSDGSVDSIVLDSSGNSLHSSITNFTSALRESADNTLNPIKNENNLTIPVLFPGYADVVQLNQDLLTSASIYDETNPNLITRLIPQHYLLEGQAFDSQTTVEGDLSNSEYQGSSIPGSGQLGSSQIMLTFLYTWAKFFDDVKLFVDNFSLIDHVDYETNETVPNNFLNRLFEKFGFTLPKQFFTDSTLEQYVEGVNIDFETSISDNSLKYIQTQLMRRILNELQTIIRSKGTLHSIKTFFRSLGIDPDTNLRIREHGGPTERQLTFARDKKTEIKPMLMFSGSSYVHSPFLVNDRIEPGYPYVSLTSNDNILTSGSWTVEGIVKYTTNIIDSLRGDQSICRLAVTGSNVSNGGVIANLVATKNDSDAILNLYLRPGTDAVNSPLKTLTLTVPNFFDVEYDKWNFSFGRFRNDEIVSAVSSSYFLRAACQNFGEILSYVTTSSFFHETTSSEINAFSAYETASKSNVSGCYIAIGSQSLPVGTSGAGYTFLNSSDISPSGSRSTFFDGMLSNLRFWSYGLSDDEWKEHVRNHNSAGVEDPLVNYDYVTTRSGSFQRLRLDTINMQDDAVTDSSGNLTLIDYSGQNFHMTGTLFPTSSAAFTPAFFSYSRLSPYFDEAASDMKVRVRGYQDQDLVDSIPWAQPGPVYEIPRNERPTDDVRFSVELSLIDALNNDIVNIFSTYEFLDNAIGKPELMFSPDYPDIQNLREIYFNKLTEKLNFKAFFEFYRWLDLTTLNFLEQLIPKKTLFKGVNFTIESHMLERHKVEYQNVDKLKLGVNNIDGKI
jgi:hypothetical protein